MGLGTTCSGWLQGRTHIVSQRSGKRIEGERLQPIHKLRLTEHGKGLLEGGHCLYDRACLGAAMGRPPAEDFIRTEEGVWLRLIPIKH